MRKSASTWHAVNARRNQNRSFWSFSNSRISGIFFMPPLERGICDAISEQCNGQMASRALLQHRFKLYHSRIQRIDRGAELSLSPIFSKRSTQKFSDSFVPPLAITDSFALGQLGTVERQK